MSESKGFPPAVDLQVPRTLSQPFVCELFTVQHKIACCAEKLFAYRVGKGPDFDPHLAYWHLHGTWIRPRMGLPSDNGESNAPAE